MMKARELIQAFGGLSKAAKAFGAPISTVQHWENTDRIPPWRERDVRDAAKTYNIKIETGGDDSHVCDRHAST